MDFYRFSIAWSRVLPDGTLTSVNEAAIEYYDKLIDRLLKKGIKPMVTMHHYDHPQILENSGGFTNASIVEHFKVYAKLLFGRFGDRVSSIGEVLRSSHSSSWMISGEIVDHIQSALGVLHLRLRIGVMATTRQWQWCWRVFVCGKHPEGACVGIPFVPRILC